MLPDSAVSVNPGAGTAGLMASGVEIKDYGYFENAVVGGGPQPRPSVVSFDVRWTAESAVNEFNNPAQQFRGSVRYALAQMEWTAQTPDYDFESAALATSTTDAAQFGQESNGSFY